MSHAVFPGWVEQLAPRKSNKKAKKSAKKSTRAKNRGRSHTLGHAGPGGEESQTLPLFGPDPQPRPRKSSTRRKSSDTEGSRIVAVEVQDGSRPAMNRSGRGALDGSDDRAGRAAIAMASKQRDISVSEFFAKNRHMLGFDSPSRAILTAVKEAVDNSLDACEEAAVLPDIVVEITELSESRFRVVVEDSGPGIVRAQVPRIFGKLLYGSKFHQLKQSRGQQGIGISAAVMYAQLTTGKPVRVTTRAGSRSTARSYSIQIDTKKNVPIVLDDKVAHWDRPHGTRVEMEIEALYKKGRRSVDAHIHQTALANPHADIRYTPPRGETVHYERLTTELPPESVAIRPHPHGVELGVLLDMAHSSKARTMSAFLTGEFSRVSPKVAGAALEISGLKPRTNPRRITREMAEKLIAAFSEVRILKPPTNCLSTVGEDLLVRSLEREFPAKFYTALTRPPAVYRGNPFQIEVALAYGVDGLSGDEPAQVYRFANRAPLIYQQSACAITQSVIATSWKSYGVAQSRGALPSGAMVLMVQIASVWVPFTSESKEAIAHYPEIIKEIKLAIQECGRRLGRYIRKGMREREEEKKRSYIEKYIPHIGIALQEILDFSEREEKRVVSTLKDTLERSRKM